MNRIQNNMLCRHVWVLLLGVTLLALSACAGNDKNLRSDSQRAGIGGRSAQNDRGQATPGRRDIDVRGLEGIDPDDRGMFTDPNNPLSTRIVYFDYDESAIPSRFSQAIRAHGRYLSRHSGVKLRLEGHTDERGSREYNVALGERRAESVKQALTASGASRRQISTLSFGEERPAELGSTEAAYAKNRRVEFIYVK